MTLYYFYRITHPLFKELNYVGSTKDFNNRKKYHESDCFNEKSLQYNKQLYQFIRGNNIDFKELNFNIISQFHLKSKEHVFKHERYWIEKYDSVENGFNKKMPYNPNGFRDYQKTEKFREYQKEWKIQYRKTESYKRWLKLYCDQKVICEICELEICRTSLKKHEKRKHSN